MSVDSDVGSESDCGSFLGGSMKYSRVLLKISGEALMGDSQYDFNAITNLVAEIKAVLDTGLCLCLVVGGGNIIRGVTSSFSSLNRVTSDHMGMLATILNALIVRDFFAVAGVDVRVMSALEISRSICEVYSVDKAVAHMDMGRLVVCAAGIGNPLFTTDTAAVLRAIELKCDLVMKGTKVDGIYTSDPKKDLDAERYDVISYRDAVLHELGFMDVSAIALARDHSMPIVVFNISQPGRFASVLRGDGVYTLCC